MKGFAGLIFFGLALAWAATALAQEVVLEVSLPRDSLNSLLQALNGTTISYQGKPREDLQAGKLTIGRMEIKRMGEGQILVGLEGRLWIHYNQRPEESLGLPLGGPLEVKTSMDFNSDLALVPQVDKTAQKLILKANVVRLELKRAEGLYDLLIQIPGIDQIARAQINKALQGMKQEVLDLSPYLEPQELSVEGSQWSADRTLVVEPRKLKIEVQPEALKVLAFARVESKAKDSRNN